MNAELIITESMNMAPFLFEWTVRSTILLVGGVLLMRALRWKDPSLRLAAWTALLAGSLAIPALMTVFPAIGFRILPPVEQAVTASAAPALPILPGNVPVAPVAANETFSWAAITLTIYLIIAGVLLLRLAIGLLLAGRIWKTGRPAGLQSSVAEIRESKRVSAPVTVGLFHPAILLPPGWREWEPAKLEAVIAHEESHIRRMDPAIQALSAFHRALLWHSPMSWVLHRSVVRLAEEASDDAAIAVMRDRPSYAGILLGFVRRVGPREKLHGAAMARYGSVESRIERILEGTALSKGITPRKLAAIAAVSLPFVYFTSTAYATRAEAQLGADGAAQSAASAAPSRQARAGAVASAQATQTPGRVSAASSRGGVIRRYKIFLGGTRSGSWNSSDRLDDSALRARYGEAFVWFERDGSEYVVTDAAVMEELKAAMEPQQKVNQMQDRVNKLQSQVNELQNKVNRQQEGVNGQQNGVNAQQQAVNAAQQEVSRLQEDINRMQTILQNGSKEAAIQELEATIQELRKTSGAANQNEVNRLQQKANEAQSRVNEAQQKVNQSQDEVNREQAKVNAQQQKVNEEQSRVSDQFSKRVQEIFGTALRNGLAKPVN